MNRVFVVVSILCLLPFFKLSSSISLKCNDAIIDDSVAYRIIDTALSMYYSVYGDSVVKLLSIKKKIDYGVVVVALNDEYDETYFDAYLYDYSDEERNNRKFFLYKDVLIVFHLSDDYEVKEGTFINCEFNTWFSSRHPYMEFGLCGEFIRMVKWEEFIFR